MKSKVGYLLIIVLFFASCSRNIVSPANTMINLSENVDYSNLENWAAHPYKKDPSDSISSPLRHHVLQDSSVDIFFLHPTTFLDNTLVNDPPPDFISPLWNANLLNKAINNKTDNSTILYQASIFNIAGRVFAPRYRQANYFAYFTRDTLNALKAFALAYNDIRHAFIYYLEHYNQGRPIVIASHSQGTTHAMLLLKEFFDGKPLGEKLVAAYLVGMPVQKNYFQKIPVCGDSLQTGCYCSWRTLREGYLTNYIKRETNNIAVTNPISWDTNLVAVSPKKNEGSILLNFNKIIKNTTGARIYKNVLWVNKPHFFGNIFYKEKNYHIADYNLFYVNVRRNVNDRVKAYEMKSGYINHF